MQVPGHGNIGTITEEYGLLLAICYGATGLIESHLAKIRSKGDNLTVVLILQPLQDD